MFTEITAVYRDRGDATAAMRDLLSMGLSAREMSVLAPGLSRGRRFVVRTSTRAAEGLGVGATAGAAVGVLVFGLVATSSIVVPGVEALADEPIGLAIMAMGIGGLFGAAAGGLFGAGVPRHEVRLEAPADATGDAEEPPPSVMLGVRVPEDDTNEVCEVLAATGAGNVCVV